MGPYISREIRFIRSVCIVNLRKEVEIFVWSVLLLRFTFPCCSNTALYIWSRHTSSLPMSPWKRNNHTSSIRKTADAFSEVITQPFLYFDDILTNSFSQAIARYTHGHASESAHRPPPKRSRHCSTLLSSFMMRQFLSSYNQKNLSRLGLSLSEMNWNDSV